jgi:Protein of unknown function (DUF2827)
MATNTKRTGGLKVGVTLYLRDGEQSLWENGIFQNCYFLLMLLARSPAVEKCFVVNGGAGDPSKASDFVAASPAPIISLDTAMNELDIVIELSAQLDPQWGRQFCQRGGRIVGMRVANDYVIDTERMIFNLPSGLLMSGTPYSEIWTLPAFVETCASYYQAGLHAPVRAMQHLWSPHFVEAAVSSRQGPPFGYVPGRARWRVAVMEPNICTVKTCHIPMLATDLAHRINPRVIEILRVYNAMKLKEHAGFVGFAHSLDLVKQGLASFEPRYPIFEILPNLGDVIVSHHWHNAQNYLYYEALHGGFPLVHNSHLLDGCGYAYKSMDPEDGALCLLQAFMEHDRNLDDYRRRAAAFLHTLDPYREENVQLYSDALANLSPPDLD